MKKIISAMALCALGLLAYSHYVLHAKPEAVVNEIGIGQSVPITPEARNARWIQLEAEYESPIHDPEMKQTALKEIREFAEQGEPRAQLFLGRIYEDGDGVSPDLHESLRWYEMAKTQKSNTPRFGTNDYQKIDERLDSSWPADHVKTMEYEAGPSNHLVVQIRRSGNSITGKGYYLPYKSEFAIIGSVDQHGQFSWTQSDALAGEAGKVEGHFGPFDHADAEWTPPGGIHSQPVQFSGFSESEYETRKSGS